jgi:hypothetical protein
MWINPRRPEKNRAKNRTRQRSAGEHDGREQERFDLRHPAPTQTLSSRSLVPRHPIGETPARDWKKMMVSDGRDRNFRWAIVFKYIWTPGPVLYCIHIVLYSYSDGRPGVVSYSYIFEYIQNIIFRSIVFLASTMSDYLLGQTSYWAICIIETIWMDNPEIWYLGDGIQCLRTLQEIWTQGETANYQKLWEVLDQDVGMLCPKSFRQTSLSFPPIHQIHKCGGWF